MFVLRHTATTEIYTLSLHDALPICPTKAMGRMKRQLRQALSNGLHGQLNAEAISFVESAKTKDFQEAVDAILGKRSEEHTSELQSLRHLVCRLLLEKKKNLTTYAVV